MGTRLTIELKHSLKALLNNFTITSYVKSKKQTLLFFYILFIFFLLFYNAIFYLVFLTRFFYLTMYTFFFISQRDFFLFLYFSCLHGNYIQEKVFHISWSASINHHIKLAQIIIDYNSPWSVDRGFRYTYWLLFVLVIRGLFSFAWSIS